MKLSIRFVAPVIVASLMAASGAAQTAREVRGAAAVEPLQHEPAAKIVIDPPLDEPLSRGRVVIQYRTENLHIVPVFGAAAVAVSPRVGHIHVTVDDASWVWADASGEPVVLNGLPPGPHTIRLELETANHQRLDQGAVTFTVPAAPSGASARARTAANEPPAKIIIDAPVAEALSRGVLFIQYRTENLHIAPVFGPAALAVAPRVGHIHVTVDDATWHWADASGNPVIINGLAPGPHNVLVQLVDANHQRVDQEVLRLTVPKRGQ
jgi:membrane protein implicated in regulation of membrane protease activity